MAALDGAYRKTLPTDDRWSYDFQEERKHRNALEEKYPLDRRPEWQKLRDRKGHSRVMKKR